MVYYYFNINFFGIILILFLVEIPPALVCMRDYLKEVDGFKEKNIFVKEGDEGEILAIRDKINREIFYDCRDVYALAKTLIVR